MIKKFIYKTLVNFYKEIFDKKSPIFITHKAYSDLLIDTYYKDYSKLEINKEKKFDQNNMRFYSHIFLEFFFHNNNFKTISIEFLSKILLYFDFSNTISISIENEYLTIL